MKSKRVQGLLTQLEQVHVELGAEFTYMESITDDQRKEIKQLRFQMRGMADMQKIYDALPTPEEVGLSTLDENQGELNFTEHFEDAKEWYRDHDGPRSMRVISYEALFEILRRWEKVNPPPKLPFHPTDLRCEDFHDYMIDYEDAADPVVAELLMEGTINGEQLPGPIVARDNALPKEVMRDWIAHFYKMGRRLAFSNPESGDYFDVLMWRWVSIVDVHAGEQS